MRAPGMTLDELNAGTAEDFVAALGAVFEDAPWVAARAAALRPFPTVAALHEAMMGVVSAAPASVRLAFLRGHPDLAGAAARARTMGAASTAEQAGLGLASLDGERLARFEAMNAAYRERHGIPFILCVRRHTRASVLAQFARRLPRGTPAEVAAALREVRFITRLRVADRVSGPGLPEVAGRLTTHVLDTGAGRPAEGLRVQLFELDGEEALLLADARTDASGGGLSTDGATVYVSTGYGRLTALDAATGEARWTQDLDAPGSSSPTILGDLAFVIARDGRAWAFELPPSGIEPLLRALIDGQAGIEALSIERPGLHDAFVAIAGADALRQINESQLNENTVGVAA